MLSNCVLLILKPIGMSDQSNSSNILIIFSLISSNYQMPIYCNEYMRQFIGYVVIKILIIGLICCNDQMPIYCNKYETIYSLFYC